MAHRFHLFDARVLQPIFGGPGELSAGVSQRLSKVNGGSGSRRGADGVELEPLSAGILAHESATISPAEPEDA